MPALAEYLPLIAGVARLVHTDTRVERSRSTGLDGCGLLAPCRGINRPKICSD